jgi:hypothetical protein
MCLRAVLTVAASTCAALVLFPAEASARKKTDLVFLTNGDRITGEITQLDRGIIQVKTDDIGTLNIEWEDVDSLNSVYQFRVEDRIGTKYFGAIFLTRADTLQVIREGRVEPVAHTDVVAIVPLEASFWQQLDGFINVGYSYTKSNSLSQLTADVYVRHRAPIRVWTLEFSSITTLQEDEDTQRRQDVTLSHSRLFEGPVFATASASAQSNDELGLELRVLFSPGVGFNLVQSNHNDLVASAGVSVNREWSDDSSGDGYNLEAFVSGSHAVFRYDYPRTDVASEITVYPSLSSWGRVRLELDVSASREVAKDFTVVLSFYDSYDSDPPDVTAETNDYGLVASLGWTF